MPAHLVIVRYNQGVTDPAWIPRWESLALPLERLAAEQDMTEAEWLEGTDVSRLVEGLEGEVSDSRLRLFACACCRRIWDLIESDLHRRAVEFAERFARGPGRDLLWLGSGHWGSRRLSRPHEQIERTEGWWAMHCELQAEQDASFADEGAFRYDNHNPKDTAGGTLGLFYHPAYTVARGAAVLRAAPEPYWRHKRALALSDEEEARLCAWIECEMASLCDLLREVYGNPFRAASLDPNWRTPAVLQVARGVVEDQAFAHLPVLADALEDTGCTNDDILSHLRSPGPHVLDCWALHLILARQ